MQEEMMTLNKFSEQIMRPMLLKNIKAGTLDYAIQLEDCQDIIEADLELKKAVDERLKVIQYAKP